MFILLATIILFLEQNLKLVVEILTLGCMRVS